MRDSRQASGPPEHMVHKSKCPLPSHCRGAAMHVRNAPMLHNAAAPREAHCLVVEERTASDTSRSLMSPTSLACSSTLRPSRNPLKKSLVLAYIILALIFAVSGALHGAAHRPACHFTFSLVALAPSIETASIEKAITV